MISRRTLVPATAYVIVASVVACVAATIPEGAEGWHLLAWGTVIALTVPWSIVWVVADDLFGIWIGVTTSIALGIALNGALVMGVGAWLSSGRRGVGEQDNATAEACKEDGR
jgi:hypothetical protein